MSRLLFLLLSLEVCLGRFVYRVVRKQQQPELGFEGDEFLRLADRQFARFDELLEQYKESSKKCVDEFVSKGDYCERRCFGQNFNRFLEGFGMVESKIFAIFQHVLDVAFNENCLGEGNGRYSCLRMLRDIKYLLSNAFDAISTVEVNASKYITPDFEQTRFDRLLALLTSLFERYDRFDKELTTRRAVMQGEVWMYYELQRQLFEAKSPLEKAVADGDFDESALRLAILTRLANLNQDQHDNYRAYVDVLKMPNPFEYEDELEREELRRIKEQTMVENTNYIQKVIREQNRPEKKPEAPNIGALLDAIREACAGSEDREFCVDTKRQELDLTEEDVSPISFEKEHKLVL